MIVDKFVNADFDTDYYIIGDYGYKIKQNEAYIKKYLGSDLDVILPKTVTIDDISYDVVGVLENAFLSKTNIVSIWIPKTMKYLEYRSLSSDNVAIFYCETNIWPNTWNEYAFGYRYTYYLDVKKEDIIKYQDIEYLLIDNEMILTKASYYLTNINVPEEITFLDKKYQVTKIGKDSFAYCEKLVNVYLPSSIVEIADRAFQYCKSLEKINFPLHLQKIGIACFNNCVMLKEVNFPPNLEYIGSFCFAFCDSLEEIIFPTTLTMIEMSTFVNCEKLAKVFIPKTLKIIGDLAFENCIDLTKILIEEDSILEEIGEEAFEACDSLSEIIIPKSVERIGADCFFKCHNLAIYCLGAGPKPGWDEDFNSSNCPIFYGGVHD